MPTLDDVLALPALRSGRPRVVSAADRLDTPVRWAHVAEIPEIPALLRGGELVLTTGIGLPRDDRGLESFLESLAGVPVAALVVELGRPHRATAGGHGQGGVAARTAPDRAATRGPFRRGH